MHHALSVGLTPHVILGDFDSVDSGWRSSLGAESTAPTVLYYPRDKDKTDGQLAVEYALDAKIKKICVYGGLGRRFDHTLGNLGLAWLCTTRGAEFHPGLPAPTCLLGNQLSYGG
mgnify:CR=1 FL=1